VERADSLLDALAEGVLMSVFRVVCLSLAVTVFLGTSTANAEPPERAIKRALRTCLLETSSPRPNETGSVDLSMPRQDLQLARALEQFRAARDAALAADPKLKDRSLEVDARPTGGVRTVPVGETLQFCDTELQARVEIWKRRMAAAYWTFGLKEEPQVACRYTYYFKADAITRTEVAPPRCDEKK
jgi:hypothetical protein